MTATDRSGRGPAKGPAALRRVTIRDVAQLARVSLGTVSNVLNRPSAVAPATRARVEAAIEQTGFVRSTAAQQLRGGRSRMVGVIVLDVANPFFTDMLRGAEDELRQHGYVLTVCSSDESVERERDYLRVLEEHRVDGLLITPAGDDLEAIAKLSARGVPTVLLDREGGGEGFCSVTVDDVRGGELAARHLIDIGHRRITFVNGPLAIRQCADRLKGAKRALRHARRASGAVLEDLPVAALTIERGEAAVAGLLTADARPTAVMCGNDLLALGVLRGLAAGGVPVPSGMAVVGYDDVSFASMLSPPLSSVRQPKYELGAAAAKLLVEETLGVEHEHRSVRFEPDLVVRASSWSEGAAALGPG